MSQPKLALAQLGIQSLMRSGRHNWNRWSVLVLGLLVLLFAFNAKIEVRSSGTGWHIPSGSVQPWLDHQKMESQLLAGWVFAVYVVSFFILLVTRPSTPLGRSHPCALRSFRAELFELRRFLRPPPVVRLGF
jgi:hypothetical protein